jgi:hypothetical protein
LIDGKQGRYVRIQLLDKNYLSLAEVQVIGSDPLNFAEVDYSSAQSDFGGVNNAPNYANKTAFAAFKDDKSILFGVRHNMKVLLIGMGAKVCFIRDTNLVVA